MLNARSYTFCEPDLCLALIGATLCTSCQTVMLKQKVHHHFVAGINTWCLQHCLNTEANRI